jgi:N-acetylglucosamine-6-phosphate deacetylase
MRASGSNSELFKWSSDIELSKYKELVDNLAGYAKIWAIDPDRKNIKEFMVYVKSVDNNAIFALGHSGATAESCEEVYSLGVKVQTHLGDSGKGPKINQAQTAAGVDEFTLCTQDMYAEIICDECGIHLSPYTIRSYIKAKGVEKIILITDSYPKTGDYKNNEKDGIKFGPDLNYDANGLLAGSHLTLDNACRNVMSYTGYGLSHAVRFAALNPAKLLGIDNLYGSVAVGKVADLLLVDDRFSVKQVYLEGEKI